MNHHTAVTGIALLALAWHGLGCGAHNASDTAKNFDAGEDAGWLDLDGDAVDGDFTACASATITATRSPADLYVMLDYSESMASSVGATDKWTAVTSALRTFFSAPESAGIGVGIQYFALFEPLAEGVGSSCDPRDYASPDVEIGTLPAAAPSLIASLDAHAFPRTETPMGPALQGAVDHAHDWAVAHPSHGVAVLLATDGEPSECTPLSVSDIASGIAAPAANGNPPILTFVLGVGDISALDEIAAAGGTGHAYLATGTQIESEILAALDAIRTKSIPCSFELPASADGGLDPRLVNVTYRESSTAKGRTVDNAANLAACGTLDGWYYDDPSAPSRIDLCPATCTEVNANSAGEIDVVLGCKTIVAPPR